MAMKNDVLADISLGNRLSHIHQKEVLLVPPIIPALQVQHSNPRFGAVRRMHWSLLAIRVH